MHTLIFNLFLFETHDKCVYVCVYVCVFTYPVYVEASLTHIYRSIQGQRGLVAFDGHQILLEHHERLECGLRHNLPQPLDIAHELDSSSVADILDGLAEHCIK